MWVEVTGIQRSEMQPIYCGKLSNDPVFIDHAKLKYGSTVYFTLDHVFPPM